MRWKARAVLSATIVVACLGLAWPAAGSATTEPTAPAELTEPIGPGYPAEIEALGGYGGPLAAGPEGALWVARSNELGRIDSDGKLTELTLSTGVGEPEGLVGGAEGNLWAAEGHGVDRITPAGQVTRFPLPQGDGEAGPIAVGADGTLWFTTWDHLHAKKRSFGKAYVIAMRPDGDMTRFPVPGPAGRRDQAPSSIVAGPEGDVWFTDPAFDRVDRLTPAGKVTEVHVRLQPVELAPDAAGGVWFVGYGGVGTIDAGGVVRELRTGNFYGIAIGSAGGAVAGPEGDLWFISGATRVMRMTPSGELSQIRGPGAPAAAHIALGPGGTIWLSTYSDVVKGETAAPLLRYQPGFPGVEVRPEIARVRAGQVRVPLACGGSPTACSGEVRIGLGGKRTIASAYEVAGESAGAATLKLPAAERRLLAARGYARVPVSATVDGGNEGFTDLILSSPHPPAPRPGRPLVMPLPEGIEVRGLVPAPDGTLWTGSDEIGRFNRITPGVGVSTVVVPGLDAAPRPIGFDAHGNLWFLGTVAGSYGVGTEPVVSRLAPDGKLSQVQLRSGPHVGAATLGADGEVWVARSYFRRGGEIERVGPAGKVTRIPVGEEPGSIITAPGGGVWFAEGGPRLAHITAAGKLRTFHVPHRGVVSGLAIDRHGNLWFTRFSRRHLPPAIGRLTPDGHLTEFPLSRHTGWPESIVAAPNGNLWFTTEFPRHIGRMTPTGKVKTWRRGAAAAGVATLGADGDIWFAAADQNTIAGFRP